MKYYNVSINLWGIALIALAYRFISDGIVSLLSGGDFLLSCGWVIAAAGLLLISLLSKGIVIEKS